MKHIPDNIPIIQVTSEHTSALPTRSSDAQLGVNLLALFGFLLFIFLVTNLWYWAKQGWSYISPFMHKVMGVVGMGWDLCTSHWIIGTVVVLVVLGIIGSFQEE